MAVTSLRRFDGDGNVVTQAASKTKIAFIVFLFILSLAAFILQTEFTSQAYKLGFKEPIILLFITHGSWWIFWPIQAFFASIWRTGRKYTSSERQHRYERLNSQSQLLEEQGALHVQHLNVLEYFKKCIVKQFHNVYHTSILVYEANVNGDRSLDNINELINKNPRISNSSSIIECLRTLSATPAFRYIFVKSFFISVVLTLGGVTWYASMALTYASDVTAIYNCSAFAAYAFAIPLLNEKFSWLKASSVIVAVVGVFIVAYSNESGGISARDTEEPYPYRFWGNLLILGGAILYGYYEVLYKKYTCVPQHLSKIITPRRQITFSNFIMCLLGIFSAFLLILGIFFAQIFHIHNFNILNYGEQTRLIWSYCIGSIAGNLLFSASFLSLMALTNPVLSSVSSLLTIFLIGLVEWFLFGNKLSIQQLFGDILVIVGFVILTVASWKEISEGKDDDDIETVSTLSFAVSTNE